MSEDSRPLLGPLSSPGEELTLTLELGNIPALPPALRTTKGLWRSRKLGLTTRPRTRIDLNSAEAVGRGWFLMEDRSPAGHVVTRLVGQPQRHHCRQQANDRRVAAPLDDLEVELEEGRIPRFCRRDPSGMALAREPEVSCASRRLPPEDAARRGSRSCH